MNSNILTVIFDDYISNSFEGICSLSQKDLQNEYDILAKFEKEYVFSAKDCNFLECDIINSLLYKSELNGFTNGFKLAVRLFSEICDNSKIAERK